MSEKQNATKVITKKCRLSFVNVFKPRASEDGDDPKYSVCLLIPKTDTVTIQKVKVAIAAAKEAGLPLWGGKVPAGLKLPLRDGDVDRPDRPEYKGMYFINCSSKQKPGIIDRDQNEIMDQSEVYSGCYGRASINFYPFNKAGSKGVGVGLNNLQKLADGEPLSGRSTAEEDFGDEEIDEDDPLA